MLRTMLSLVAIHVGFLAASTAVAASLEPGTAVSYRGLLKRLVVDPDGETHKRFDLTFHVIAADDNGIDAWWLLQEDGCGAFAWPDRFGRLQADARKNAPGAASPALRYEFRDLHGTVPLVGPLVGSEKPLAAAAKWQEANLDYEVLAVADGKRLPEQKLWEVAAGNAYGRKRTYAVDQDTNLIEGLTEKLFFGQGVDHELTMELVGVEKPSAEQTQRLAATFGELAALRTKINRPARAATATWNAKQLEAIAAALPELEKLAADSPLATIVQAARADVQAQQGRAGAVAELAAKQIGREVQQFSAAHLAGGDPLTNATIKDGVTLLHFWGYQGDNLAEPYGQVGYLPLLINRHKAAGLKVYGVAVDARLAEPNGRSAAMQSIKKLQKFMNLRYPLLVDDGQLLAQFGDPRPAGAELPLFVVIGRDGKIAHYHAGVYSVDKSAGLKELDDVIAEAVKSQAAK